MAEKCNGLVVDFGEEVRRLVIANDAYRKKVALLCVNRETSFGMIFFENYNTESNVETDVHTFYITFSIIKKL